MTVMATFSGAEAVRAYIRALRDASPYTQKQFAKEIGLSERAYIDYETGETQELKQSSLVRALELLCAPYEDVRDLILGNSNADVGRDLAIKRLEPSVQERIRALEATEEGRQALIDAAKRHL